MSRRKKALFLFLGLAVVLALLAAKMIAQVRRGEDLFWLAELWAPAAVLCIGVVTGIEFLLSPAPPSIPAQAPAPAAAKPRPTAARRAPAKKKKAVK